MARSPNSLISQLTCGMMSSKLHGRSAEDSSITEQPPTKKRRVNKKVRIAEEENELHYLPYDEDHKNRVWMQESDFTAIKQGNRQTLIEILQSYGEMSKIDASEFCLRGLEDHLEVFFLKQNPQKRKTVIQRVLADQNAQRANGVRDPDMLSKVYGHLSQQATQRALELAYVDALR